MKPFDSNAYGGIVAPLLVRSSLPELGPGVPDMSLRGALAALSPESLFPKLNDRSMAMACISGLWLLHDFLNESHEISQELASSTGSYWHGIIHRREPDASNSKYWWRQVGAHPVLDLLGIEAPKIGYDFRGPNEFVDFCESARGTGSPDEDLAKRVQMFEWQLLFDWCWQKSI